MDEKSGTNNMLFKGSINYIYLYIRLITAGAMVSLLGFNDSVEAHSAYWENAPAMQGEIISPSNGVVVCAGGTLSYGAEGSDKDTFHPVTCQDLDEHGTEVHSDNVNFSWSGPGSFSNPNNSSGTWTAPDIPGKVTLSVKITDDGVDERDDGVITDTAEVTVVGVKSVDGPSAVCLGDPATFTANPDPSGAFFPYGHLKWQYKKTGGNALWVDAGWGPSTEIRFPTVGGYTVRATCGTSKAQRAVTVGEVDITRVQQIYGGSRLKRTLELVIKGTGYPDGLNVNCVATIVGADQQWVDPDTANDAATVGGRQWHVKVGPFKTVDGTGGGTFTGIWVDIEATITLGPGVQCRDIRRIELMDVRQAIPEQ